MVFLFRKVFYFVSFVGYFNKTFFGEIVVGMPGKASLLLKEMNA